MSELAPQITMIAAGTTIKGEVLCDGPLQLHGRVEGGVEGRDAVEIMPDAVIIGNVKAEVIELHGTVDGNLCATSACRLQPSAQLNGELRARSLAISEGASFIGKVYVGAAAMDEAADTAAPAQTPQSPAAPMLRHAERALADPQIRVMPSAAQAVVNRAPRIIKAAPYAAHGAA